MNKNLFIVILSLAVISSAALLLSSKTKPTPAPFIPTPIPTQISQTVPLPNGEDIIRTFFELINKRKYPEVLEMMNSQMIPDDNAKQEWVVAFNGIASISVSKIESHLPEDWSKSSQIYKVILQVRNQYGVPSFIPDNGENTRWIQLTQTGAAWKISNIATGP